MIISEELEVSNFLHILHGVSTCLQRLVALLEVHKHGEPICNRHMMS